MLVDTEIGNMLTHGKVTYGNRFQRKNTIEGVTNTVGNSAFKMEMLKQFINLRSKRDGKLFKDIVMGSNATPDVVLQVTAKLKKEYEGWNNVDKGAANPSGSTKETVLSQVKMPPKILRRGRPKGAMVTAVGLPKKKSPKISRPRKFERKDPKSKQMSDAALAVPVIRKIALPANVFFQSGKIMQLQLKQQGIRTIDSNNFITMSLSQFHKSFELHELKKGWFTYLFNQKSKQKRLALAILTFWTTIYL